MLINSSPLNKRAINSGLAAGDVTFIALETLQQNVLASLESNTDLETYQQEVVFHAAGTTANLETLQQNVITPTYSANRLETLLQRVET